MRYLPILIIAILTTAAIVVVQPGRQPDASYLTYIQYKRKNEAEAIRLRPHPYEFHLYYDI